MKRLITVAAALGLAAMTLGPQLSSAQSGSVWATFHGNGQRSGASTVNGPTTAALSNQWQLPKAAGSSVAIDSSGIGYVGDADGYVYALDPGKGATWKWRFKTGGPVFSTPTLSNDGKTLYVGSEDGNVYAVDTATGKKVWSSAQRGPVDASPLLSSDGSTLFVPDITGNFQALKASDGSKVWGPNNFGSGGAIPGSFAMSPDGSTIYAGTSSFVYGFPSAGLQGTATASTFYLSGTAMSSPAVDSSGNVYIGTSAGYVTSYAPGTNGLRWNFEVPDLSAVRSTPTIGNSLVIFGSDNGNVYALNQSTKDIVWTYKTGGPVSSSAVIAANGLVYIGSSDDRIYALVASNGNVAWSRDLGAPVSSSPALASDGSLWVATGGQSGAVFRLKQAAGPPSPPPTGKPGATATATGTATTPGTTGHISVTAKKQIKPSKKQTIKVTTNPNTRVHIRITYPNGDHQSHSGTSSAAGTLSYSYKQGASKIWHNRFYATVKAWIGSGATQVSATTQYKINFGSIDVTAEPRTQSVGHIVNVYVHMTRRTLVRAYLTFPNRRVKMMQGRTGPKGWAHLRYKVARGMKKGKNHKVSVMARPASSRPKISTKTSFTIK